MSTRLDVKILSDTSQTCKCGHPRIAHDWPTKSEMKEMKKPRMLVCWECGSCWNYEAEK